MLDGNKENQTLGNAIVLDSVDHVWLSRLWIKNAKQEGIYAYPLATPYCGLINIDRCFISGCGDAGIWLNATDSYIRGCDIGQNAYGIVLEGWSNLVEGNNLWGNTYYGLYVKESYHNRVIGNRIDFNKRHGIYCEDGVKELIIALNHIYMNSQELANTYDGIHVYGSSTKPTDHILILGNHIGTSYLHDTTSETQRNNIDIEGTAYTTNVTILMNDLLNCRNHRLWFDGDPSTALIKYNKGYRTENSGTATFSGDGSTMTFTIAHGLVWTPKMAVVTAGSNDAKGDFYVTYDGINIYVTFATAPPSGTNNVVLRWYAEM
jgi:parallel beta-helix repeat protein